MPSFQQVGFLEEAVRSVLDHEDVFVELLVMDPGSTDGSLELLLELQKEYAERLILYLEMDHGQSDAINKGLLRANGRILGWLNSDDRLRPGALSKIANWLDSAEPRWLYGRAGVIDEKSRPHLNFIVRYKNWRGRKFSRLKLLTENFIPQMAVFWNRAMWERVGELDIDRHLDMDYDLWLRFAKVSEPLVLEDVLADFRIHGNAKGNRQSGAQLGEAYATARKYSGELGWRGQVALGTHRLLSMRTRIIYRWLKS
jgi:glycosyltransferase involved in cell wall biosynthesis